MGVDWNLAGAVIISGLVLVFVVLIILILILMGIGKYLGSTAKSNLSPVPPPAAKPAAPAPAAQTVLPAKDAASDHIAVISAAVAAMMEEEAPGTAYTITNIRRARGSRPIWGFTGMQQNTRPF